MQFDVHLDLSSKGFQSALILPRKNLFDHNIRTRIACTEHFSHAASAYALPNGNMGCWNDTEDAKRLHTRRILLRAA
jgi:hypothetical protein